MLKIQRKREEKEKEERLSLDDGGNISKSKANNHILAQLDGKNITSQLSSLNSGAAQRLNSNGGKFRNAWKVYFKPLV